MRKRSATAGTMSKKDARFLTGWRVAKATERHGKKIREIDERLTRAKSECAQEAAQIAAELDVAVQKEREAVENAKQAKKRAGDRARAARHRKKVEARLRRARKVQKGRECKAEAVALREQERAERELRDQEVRIERRRRGDRATKDAAITEVRRRHAARLSEIAETLRRQRSECAQEAEQIARELDAAVQREQAAIDQAKADARAAGDAKKAAQHRLDVERRHRRAKNAQKKRQCKAEAEALKDKGRAEREHQAEVISLERALLQRQTEDRKPTLSLREQREQVEADVPEMYRPLWQKVRRTFQIPKRKEGRASLLEAFLEFAAESPDAVAEAQEEAMQREIQEMERQARKQHRGLVKARPRAPRARASGYVEGVPF